MELLRSSTVNSARRKLVLGATTGAFLSCQCRPTLAQSKNAQQTSCLFLSDAEPLELGDSASFAGQSNDRYGASSGQPPLDRGLSILARQLVTQFRLGDSPPAVQYIVEGRTGGAYATRKTEIVGTGGTVLVGRDLLLEHYQKPPDGYLIATCILAHEFAHMYQYQREYWKSFTCRKVECLELTADFLAGWYIGRSGLPAERAYTIATTMFQRGDFAYGSAQHHGRPGDRYTMTMEGFKFGAIKGEGEVFQQSSDVDIAGQKAKELLDPLLDRPSC